jgi:hypothetical protein
LERRLECLPKGSKSVRNRTVFYYTLASYIKNMDIALQTWGGGFYLINKILFALAEGKKQKLKRQLKIYGWVIYILGVPAWVIILLSKHNWIAASIEAGGVPSMMFGLYTIYKNSKTQNRNFDKVASFCTYGSITLGVGYSLFEAVGVVATYAAKDCIFV